MIEKLSHEEFYALIVRAEQRGILQSVREGMMSEADVFLCEYQGMRVNFYFDLAYGAYIKAVDPISSEIMEEMKRTLETI